MGIHNLTAWGMEHVGTQVLKLVQLLFHITLVDEVHVLLSLYGNGNTHARMGMEHVCTQYIRRWEHNMYGDTHCVGMECMGTQKTLGVYGEWGIIQNGNTSMEWE